MEYFDISAWWLAWCVSNQVNNLKWTKYSKMEYSGIPAWWLAWCVSNCYTWNHLSRNVNIFPVQCPIKEVSHFDWFVIGLMCIQPLHAESLVMKRQYLSCSMSHQEVSHFDCSSCNKVQYIPWWIETLVFMLIRNLQTLQSKYSCQL